MSLYIGHIAVNNNAQPRTFILASPIPIPEPKEGYSAVLFLVETQLMPAFRQKLRYAEIHCYVFCCVLIPLAEVRWVVVEGSNRAGFRATQISFLGIWVARKPVGFEPSTTTPHFCKGNKCATKRIAVDNPPQAMAIALHLTEMNVSGCTLLYGFAYIQTGWHVCVCVCIGLANL